MLKNRFQGRSCGFAWLSGLANPWLNCRPPAVTLPVSATPTVQSIRWSAFVGGLPTGTTDGSDLLALQWSFDWVDGAIPYAGQLTIDDLEFFDDAGQGGAGGAGGAPASDHP